MVKDSFKSMFKMIDPNDKYVPVKIASFYYLVGEGLVYHPIKNLMGDIDMRFSHGVCITSGRGKDAIKNVAYVAAEELGMKYSEFTSLHEEQLIGKKWKDKDSKQHKQVLGYFGDDFVEKDDGLLFINGEKYELARNYWLRCLNPYGKNQISKRLTEMEDGLKYMGTASLRYFIQISEKIKIKNLTSGLFRRCPILRVDLTKEEERQIMYSRLNNDFKPEPKEMYDFLRILRNIRILRYIKINKNLINKINRECEQYESENSLLNSLYLENQNIIVKWSYINALLRKYTLKSLKSLKSLDLELIDEDVEHAIQDYRIVYGSIKSFVFGNCVTNEIDCAIVNFIKLAKQDISSPEVIDGVSKILNEPSDTVKHHFYNLKKLGFINSKQITNRIQDENNRWKNETTSKVWI